MKPILKIVNTQQSEAFQIMKVNDPYFFRPGIFILN